jgi:hypothetical protein
VFQRAVIAFTAVLLHVNCVGYFVSTGVAFWLSQSTFQEGRMMIHSRTVLLALLLIAFPATGRAPYVSIAVGGQPGKTINAETGAARADFDTATVFGVGFGWGPIPYAGLQAYYSHATPELTWSRGDALGSRAVADISTHTLTLEGRIHTPTFARFRLYGFVGGGASRFNVDIKEQLEVPFPGGEPDSVVSSVLTYGGGVERIFFPYLRWRLEVRNNVSDLPDELLLGDRKWNRPQFAAGILIGK